MLWCIAPVVAAGPSRAPLRIDEVRHAIECANVESGIDHKTLADFMGFSADRIGMYYRQIRQHGVNLNLLLNAEPRWWLAFIVRITKLLGISDAQVAAAFGLAYQTEEDVQREKDAREAHDRAVDERLRRLEELAGVPTPAPVTHPPADEDTPDETTDRPGARCHRDRDAVRSAALCGGPDAEARDLRAVQVPVQGRAALRNLLDLRVVSEWS